MSFSHKDLTSLGKEIRSAIAQATDIAALEAVVRRYASRSGILTQAIRGLKDIADPTARREAGARLNELKESLHSVVEDKRTKLEIAFAQGKESKEQLDVTAPGVGVPVGHPHPLTRVSEEVISICRDLGFIAVEGPELETEFYNFTALNIPAEHPARDLWNTFWLQSGEGVLLRTHTSPMQARYLEQHAPPVRIIVPGKVYRYEAIDRTHEAQFSQMEGLLVDKEVSIAHFRAIMGALLGRVFGQREVAIRLRPSYFPFVEPGFEVDMACVFCKQEGCEICKGTGWLEMAGAGLVHPNVFKAVGLKRGAWQGFAFGLGIDRLAMLKYAIRDIRTLYSGDVHLTRQFH